MLQRTEISQRNDVKGHNLSRHVTESAAEVALMADAPM